MNRDYTLSYVLESLSNWLDTHEEARSLYKKMVNHMYEDEQAFARELSPQESHFLTDVLSKELDYAKQVGDHVRLHQLNELYEQLY